MLAAAWCGKGTTVIFERLYQLDLTILYPLVIIMLAAAAELGHQIGWRSRRKESEHADLGTLTGAALGLLALLLAFSFSIALSRYDVRRNMVLEEANAIGSTANFALMLPAPRSSRSWICCASIPRSGSGLASHSTRQSWSAT
jgi:hypothetical protein